jgi:AcrR family transcriptional regulator
MTTLTSTPDKILEASRRLFNSKGYAATSLSEIAAAIGISQGNLTYHFPATSDLAARIDAEARKRLRERRATRQPGRVADDYVAH